MEYNCSTHETYYVSCFPKQLYLKSDCIQFISYTYKNNGEGYKRKGSNFNFQDDKDLDLSVK